MSEIWNLSTLCRCCHADGHFKSLNLSYQGKNDVEIYENMLRETLGIFYWADKKFTLKRTCAQHAQSMRRTGGGTADNLPALTPIDQRLLAVMGGLQFATGDSHVAANPFPSTISNEPVPQDASYTICDDCICKLRDATEFKNQVLMCEQKFKVYCNNEQLVTCEIKLEGENDEDDFYNDDVTTEVEIDQKVTLDLKKDDVSIDVEIDEKLTLDVKKEIQPNTEIVNEEKDASENETKPEIPKPNLKKKININKRKITKNKEQKNQPSPDTVSEEKVASENETKPEEIPKTNLKKKININNRKITKNKEQSKRRKIFDRSLIVKVDTDTGNEFSCKDCGGLYQTEKEITKHIHKAHATLFKCEYCPKQLKTFGNLKNHLRLHTGKEFTCNFCPKNFASINALKTHENSHTQEKIYKCHLCDKEYKYRQTLNKHLKVHAGTNKKILCDICGWSFNDKSNLNAHIRSVHEKLRPFNCKICQKTYSNQRHLRDHLKVHNGDEKVFKCDICDKRLSSPKTMKIHRLKHENKFLCSFCPTIFDDSLSKLEHIKSVHNKVLPWIPCPLCGKVFSGKFSLNRHIDEHNGIKKFSCDICGIKFTQKAILNRHVSRKHNSDTDIDIGKAKCDICKRSYKNIVTHMESHKNRLKECDLCGKTYRDSSTLNRHKSLKHFGKNFGCSICEKKYLKKSTLNTHLKKVHMIKIEKDCEEGS